MFCCLTNFMGFCEIDAQNEHQFSVWRVSFLTIPSGTASKKHHLAKKYRLFGRYSTYQIHLLYHLILMYLFLHSTSRLFVMSSVPIGLPLVLDLTLLCCRQVVLFRSQVLWQRYVLESVCLFVQSLHFLTCKIGFNPILQVFCC